MLIEQLGGFNILNCESTHSEGTLTLSHKKGTTLIKYEEKAVKTNKNNKNKSSTTSEPKQSKKRAFFSFQTSQQFVLPFFFFFFFLFLSSYLVFSYSILFENNYSILTNHLPLISFLTMYRQFTRGFSSSFASQKLSSTIKT